MLNLFQHLELKYKYIKILKPHYAKATRGRQVQNDTIGGFWIHGFYTCSSVISVWLFLKARRCQWWSR